MSKKVGIIQSNYIPWRGYFDFISCVDEFIIFDDVQYTRRDWRNRNKIRTPNGLQWLTIPVEVKGKYLQLVNETRISDPNWAQKHLGSLKHNYSKSKHFDQFYNEIADIYNQAAELEMLSNINLLFINFIVEKLGIITQISSSSDYGVVAGKNDRLLDLCKKAHADIYVSGPAAKDYLDENIFNEAGVMVEWMDYSGYKDYPQVHEGFEPFVSILDLFFNMGDNAKEYLKFL